jgi:BMFP domain-containing protein YqiC
MLTRARARIAELEAQVGTLQEKLAKSQAQLKALIDLG